MNARIERMKERSFGFNFMKKENKKLRVKTGTCDACAMRMLYRVFTEYRLDWLKLALF